MPKKCTHVGSQADRLLFSVGFVRKHLACEKCAKTMAEELFKNRHQPGGKRVAKSTVLVLDGSARKSLMKEIGDRQDEFESGKVSGLTSRTKMTVWDAGNKGAKRTKKRFKFAVRKGPKGPKSDGKWQINHFDRLA